MIDKIKKARNGTTFRIVYILRKKEKGIRKRHMGNIKDTSRIKIYFLDWIVKT